MKKLFNVPTFLMSKPLFDESGDCYCSCHKGRECGAIGKHPIQKIKGNEENALKTLGQRLRDNKSFGKNFLNKFNYGFLTGEKSGITIIDFDDMEIAKQYIKFCLEFKLPTTNIVKTSKGIHLYFNYTNLLKTKNWGKYKVDIKNDKSSCTGIGSTHKSGKKYKVQKTLSEFEVSDFTTKHFDFMKKIIPELGITEGYELPEVFKKGLEEERSQTRRGLPTTENIVKILSAYDYNCRDTWLKVGWSLGSTYKYTDAENEIYSLYEAWSGLYPGFSEDDAQKTEFCFYDEWENNNHQDPITIGSFVGKFFTLNDDKQDVKNTFNYLVEVLDDFRKQTKKVNIVIPKKVEGCENESENESENGSESDENDEGAFMIKIQNIIDGKYFKFHKGMDLRKVEDASMLFPTLIQQADENLKNYKKACDMKLIKENKDITFKLEEYYFRLKNLLSLVYNPRTNKIYAVNGKQSGDWNKKSFDNTFNFTFEIPHPDDDNDTTNIYSCYELLQTFFAASVFIKSPKYPYGFVHEKAYWERSGEGDLEDDTDIVRGVANSFRFKHLTPYHTMSPSPKPLTREKMERLRETTKDNILCRVAENLIPSEYDREVVYKFLANNYQNPSSKNRYSIVLSGVQGNGKDTLWHIYKQVIGEAVSSSVGFDEVSQSFNHWRAAHFVTISETDSVKYNPKQKYSMLKQTITNNSDWVTINQKYGAIIQAFDSTSIVVNSNNIQDDFEFASDDRRFYVVKTQNHREVYVENGDYDQQKYANFFKMINEKIKDVAEIKKVALFLQSIDLTGYNTSVCPSNEYKEELIQTQTFDENATRAFAMYFDYCIKNNFPPGFIRSDIIYALIHKYEKEEDQYLTLSVSTYRNRIKVGKILTYHNLKHIAKPPRENGVKSNVYYRESLRETAVSRKAIKLLMQECVKFTATDVLMACESIDWGKRLNQVQDKQFTINAMREMGFTKVKNKGLVGEAGNLKYVNGRYVYDTNYDDNGEIYE